MNQPKRNRTNYPFPENLLRDLISRLENPLKYLEKVDLQKAISMFGEKYCRHFKGVSDKSKEVILFYYKHTDSNYETVADNYELTPQRVRNLISEGMKVLSANIDTFFVEDSLLDEKQKLEDDYRAEISYYKNRIKELSKQLSKLNTGDEITDLVNARDVLINTAISNLKIDINTYSKLLKNAIKTIDQLVGFAEEELMAQCSLSKRELNLINYALKEYGVKILKKEEIKNGKSH